MDSTPHVVVVGAGIVGVSAAIWLRRAGFVVTLVDRAAPGSGTSWGNAGVLAACSVVPVTSPGLVRKAPGFVMDPDFPLFLRWGYLPRLAPWLAKYLSHANDADTRRIALGLAPLVADSVAQHRALVEGTDAAGWVADSDYAFAYADRAAFDADAYSWTLRREAGFEPKLLEGEAVREREPALGPATGLLALMKDHGFVGDPGGYVGALARTFETMGGRRLTAELLDIELDADRVAGLALHAIDGDRTLDCDAVVLATGVWSKTLARKLGLDVPLESERGYHIVYESPSGGPQLPVMVAAGKFVATPMQHGLRCAGIVEFGGLDAAASAAPLALLRKQVRTCFPDLVSTGEHEWLGHRPAPVDSLPLIGELPNVRGAWAAFGHHHVGLTAGPKTGRLIAELIARRETSVDVRPYAPGRFLH